MIFADTIVLSDLHLGSEVSRASDALRMLKSASFNRLILLGDIFSDLNFRRLKKEHWQFLGYIRKLSNPKREIEVVWVEGNHDHGLSDVMSHLVGIRVYQEYSWEYGGLKHLAIHGHQFDRFVTRNRVLSTFLSSIHLGLQEIRFWKKADELAFLSVSTPLGFDFPPRSPAGRLRMHDPKIQIAYSVAIPMKL